MPQCRNESRDLAMTMRRLSDQALPFHRTAAKPRHVRGSCGLVNKDQTGRVQRRPVFPPGPRAALMSGRSCSVACRVFFKGDIMAAEEPPQARRTFLQIVRVRQPCLDLGQRCIRLLRDECQQPFLVLFESLDR